MLVTALGDLRPGVVEQVAAVTAVVPDCLTAAEGKAASVRMNFVGVDAAALAGLQIEAGEGEILARSASVQAPAADVDRGAAVVGDDGVFIAFYP